MVSHDEICQITFLAPVFPVNCYLIKEEDGLTLIDAAFSFSAKRIIKEAESLGLPITRIIITHAHEDHIGALDKLREKYPDVPIFISKRDARLLAGDISTDETEPDSPITGGFLKKLKTKPDILMEDGDRVGSLLAISTPGHTPGSMSFLDTRTNALITGDAFQTQGGIAVSGQMRPLFPFPALGTWNKQSSLESALKLISYQPSLLACGHGKMVENPVPEMKRAIEQAEQKLRLA